MCTYVYAGVVAPSSPFCQFTLHLLSDEGGSMPLTPAPCGGSWEYRGGACSLLVEMRYITDGIRDDEVLVTYSKTTQHSFFVFCRR